MGLNNSKNNDIGVRHRDNFMDALFRSQSTKQGIQFIV